MNMENKLQNIHHKKIILYHSRTFITDLEKDVIQGSHTKSIKDNLLKAAKIYDGLKDSQAKQI
jgi:hypothetical protein